jgi:carboxymethylenebutenolidase
MEGYLALPERPGSRRPAVVVIHEIWGLDAHIRDVCDRFAREGFVALGPQLYDRETVAAMTPERVVGAMAILRSAPPEVQRDSHRMASLLEGKAPPERAALQSIMRVLDPRQSRVFGEDVVRALAYVRGREEVDAGRTATLGFCMGGGLSALAAALDPQLTAAVIFYGANPPAELVPRIRASLLGLYGGEDHRITDTVPALVEETRRASVRFTYHVYPKAQHAFFNDTRPQVYDPQAAADAWVRVLSFLREQLGG